MRRAAFALLACAGCADVPGTENPIAPGTTGSGAATATGTGFVDGGVVLVGRVCVIDSLLTTNCATTGVENLTVSVATPGTTTTTAVATTTSNGTFVVTTPIVGTSPVFTVTGPAVVTTSQALNARAQINVLRQEAFNEMLAVTGVSPIDGTGSVVATVTNPAGIPVSGVTAVSVPMGVFGPFFDGSQPMPWVLNGTGVNGIVWFPSLMVGPAELSFNTLTGGEAIVGGVQVINGGITMVETPLP